MPNNLTPIEVRHRAGLALERIENRVETAKAIGRDLTPAEMDLVNLDRQELAELREVERTQSEVNERVGIINRAIIEHRSRDSRLNPLMLSARNLETLEEARRNFATVTVFERAMLKTTDMGTAVDYEASGLQGPRSLWQASGIPTSVPDGYSGVVPQFTLPAGVALVAEAVAHAEFDAVNPDNVAIKRAGAWSSLSSEGALSTSIAEISQAHARIIARNLDVATVAKLESAPGGLGIDSGLTTVAAEASCDVSDLWIVGHPLTVAELAGNAVFGVTNAADIGSYATRYGGAAIYPTPAATVDRLTVFHPQSFRAFASSLASAVVVDPKDGSQTFGQWMFYGLGKSLVGGAVTVTLGGS
jgi:hypothetical protein